MQSNLRSAHIPTLSISLHNQLKAMLDNFNGFAQLCVALRNWTTPVDAPNPYRMVIHNNQFQSGKHVCRSNSSHASKIAAIILGVDKGITGRQYIVVSRRGELNESDTTRFLTAVKPR